MLKHTSWLVSVAVFFVAASPFGKDEGRWQLLPVLSAQDTAPEACSLLSVEELEKLLGRPFGRSRQRPEQSGTSCHFRTGAGGGITVAVGASSKTQFAEFRKLLSDEGQKLEAVTGIGDEAYYWDTRIYVRVGNRMMSIWNGDSMQRAEKARGEALTLAKVLAPKLR